MNKNFPPGRDGWCIDKFMSSQSIGRLQRWRTVCFELSALLRRVETWSLRFDRRLLIVISCKLHPKWPAMDTRNALLTMRVGISYRLTIYIWTRNINIRKFLYHNICIFPPFVNINIFYCRRCKCGWHSFGCQINFHRLIKKELSDESHRRRILTGISINWSRIVCKSDAILTDMLFFHIFLKAEV